MKRYRFYKLITILLICLLCGSRSLLAYSVLTHEAIIDATWEQSIKPLLLEKYPATTPDQLKDAHAYAYGGCVVPDMGFYPFGDKFFTNLFHYVRTGDMVNTMLEEAQDVNEYAFALGVLCHYNADKYGHPIAINRSVPMVYPKDRKKFGSVVTYQQDPISHVRMEFGFDVIQTARGNYASMAYHDFIGFKVSRPLLERAFVKTYGLDINDEVKDLSLSIESFRWVVKNFFPTITRTAWAAKKKDIKKMTPTMTRKKFEYSMSKTNYYHEFGKAHEKPGFFPSMLAVVIRVTPKIGPLKDLKIKIPGPEAEQLFIHSFDTVLAHYRQSLKKLQGENNHFANIDFDTGRDTWPEEYELADTSYEILLLKLKDDNFKNVDAGLKQNILQFYSQCSEKMAAMTGLKKWVEVTSALDQLKGLQVNDKHESKRITQH
jgi:hypothetical protein